MVLCSSTVQAKRINRRKRSLLKQEKHGWVIRQIKTRYRLTITPKEYTTPHALPVQPFHLFATALCAVSFLHDTMLRSLFLLQDNRSWCKNYLMLHLQSGILSKQNMAHLHVSLLAKLC